MRGKSSHASWKAVASEEAADIAVVDKTSVYADIVQLQAVLVKLYFFLPFLLVLLVSEVRMFIDDIKIACCHHGSANAFTRPQLLSD